MKDRKREVKKNLIFDGSSSENCSMEQIEQNAENTPRPIKKEQNLVGKKKITVNSNGEFR